jgi:hypothetical protein
MVRTMRVPGAQLETASSVVSIASRTRYIATDSGQCPLCASDQMFGQSQFASTHVEPLGRTYVLRYEWLS